jgi:hypothetical protein
VPRPPITNKKAMYRLLQAGLLGNTIPLYPTLETWLNAPDLRSYPKWGVRCLTPGDKRMRLNVPIDEVVNYVTTNFPTGEGFNISPMIDQWAIFKGEVYEQYHTPPYGLCAYVNFKGNMPWREALRDYGQHFFGLEAKLQLQKYMDSSSYDDVRTLLEEYPDHVVEFSVCDRSVGVIPGRNSVIWEVRKY